MIVQLLTTALVRWMRPEQLEAERSRCLRQAIQQPFCSPRAYVDRILAEPSQGLVRAVAWWEVERTLARETVIQPSAWARDDGPHLLT